MHGVSGVYVSAQGVLRSLLNYDSECEQGVCLGLAYAHAHSSSCVLHVCSGARARTSVWVCVCVGSSSKKVRGY